MSRNRILISIDIPQGVIPKDMNISELESHIVSNNSTFDVRDYVNTLIEGGNTNEVVDLLNQGSILLMEQCLGGIVRELNKSPESVSNITLWLFLTSIFSRSNIIPSQSPSRITISGVLYLCDITNEWFSILINPIDKFLLKSLTKSNPLIQEQVVSVLCMNTSLTYWPRSKGVISKCKLVLVPIVNRLDDMELKEAWSEGITTFLNSLKEGKLNVSSNTKEDILNYISNTELSNVTKSNILRFIDGINY